MPKEYKHEGVLVAARTIEGLGGAEALELPAEEVRERIAARDNGTAQMLAGYRKQLGIIDGPVKGEGEDKAERVETKTDREAN